MRQFGSLLLLLCLASLPVRADGIWSGGWDTRWRGGGSHMELFQDGPHVTGSYPLYGGRIDAQAIGRALVGRWVEGPRSGGFRFDISDDGRTFTGRFDTGEWWTGGRGPARQLVVAADQNGVRETLRTFLIGANLAHAGLVDQVGLAVSVMDFGDVSSTSTNSGGMATGEKVAAARTLADLVDLTTLHLWAIPGKRTPGDSYDLVLHQAGTDASLPLSFRRHADGRWWLLAPPGSVLATARTALLARTGGRPLQPDAFLAMRDARDTMSTFQSAFSHWNEGGAAQALRTLDTSQLAPATRTYEGTLAVQYLKRVIDRIGQAAPQEIPNDPADRQPYVHFEHPAGRIVIAPEGEGAAQVWRFTPETVRTAAALFAAMEAVPVAATGALPPPQTAFFRLRAWVAHLSASLLQPFGAVEAWQILAGIAFAFGCLLVAVVLAAIVLALVRWRVGGQILSSERRLVWPLRIALAAVLFKLVVPVLGWPEGVRAFTAPVHALIIAAFGVWAGWKLLNALGRSFSDEADRGSARLDGIVVSLVIGALRLTLLFAAISYAADQLSIPTNGILAGLGISGLAVAFASKETLSNIFGAGILVVDHPFRRGDWIVADDVQGTVEHVGIRSTRVRTAEDTVLVVPNGKLADASINNWGTRRHRLSRSKLLVGYGGTPGQLDAFIAGLRRIIADTPEAVASRTQVGVTSLSDKGIEIDATTYLAVGSDERRVSHDMLLRIIALAEEIGLRLGAADAAPPAKPPQGAANSGKPTAAHAIAD